MERRRRCFPSPPKTIIGREVISFRKIVLNLMHETIEKLFYSRCGFGSFNKSFRTCAFKWQSLLFGNYRHQDIYKYSCAGSINSCKWTKIAFKSKDFQREPVVFPISDSFVDKLCKWMVFHFPPQKGLLLIKATK